METSENQQKTICKKLKDFFQKKGMSQIQIAETLGVSQPLIGALLNGKPFGKKTASVWGKAFGLRPNWLLTGEGEMLEKPEILSYPENAAFDRVAESETTVDYRFVDQRMFPHISNADPRADRMWQEYERISAMVEKLSSANEKLVVSNQRLIDELLEKLNIK